MASKDVGMVELLQYFNLGEEEFLELLAFETV
jgi:hypothetical protein